MNHLVNQTSPYLLQHAENPVEWYPWCKEAFDRAREENKPVFLSIGYSTCHWCHVMARESFEDAEIAEILNQYFISIKVDREERPDLDNVYMSVCQALTGSGGWPMTVFLTPEKKPFFAGTYFPKNTRYGQIGLKQLLLTIHEKWSQEPDSLIYSAEEILSILDGGDKQEVSLGEKDREGKSLSEQGENIAILNSAVSIYKQTFDKEYGGFGAAPKFPIPHNLLFLMQHFEKNRDEAALNMVEKSLLQMYRGGIFDHIGGGFCRYSTDRYFFVPHFEKMLYDNALLILAYSKAFQLTKKQIYLDIAEKTAAYILREMTDADGGFYSAQDADSEGMEGIYYLFEPSEIEKVLGESQGREFNRHFDITEEGNFQGKNIPNLLKSEKGKKLSKNFEGCFSKLLKYRKDRFSLHLDDKILMSSNALMIAAMSSLYRVTGEKTYLRAAVRADRFLNEKLCEGDTLYVSYRDKRHSGKGFLNDYANFIYASLCLYEASFKKVYLERARKFCEKTIDLFYDHSQGGFFLYGQENEDLILKPKEIYDGAMPSGNSVMAYNLVWLYVITLEPCYRDFAEKQLHFMEKEVRQYPAGYSMFLMALSDYVIAPNQIVIVVGDTALTEELSCRIPLNTVVRVLERPSKEYPLKNQKTTFYICEGNTCRPPVNDL